MSSDGAERTEEATTKRRGKERDKGNISKSQDLTSALMITIGLALLGMFLGFISQHIQTMFYDTFTHLHPQDINTEDILAIFAPFAQDAGIILLPFLLVLCFCAIVIVRMQIGHVFAKEKLKFDFNNISPKKMIDGAKKLFNPFAPRTMVEFLKSLLKLLIVGGCGLSVLSSRKDELLALIGMDLNNAFAVIISILSQMLINMCLAMLVIGFLDKKYQDYEYEKSIKMTKQEVKDEMKESEGDPKIKSKIRSIQMQMMRQRMMSAIPQADVVVTNPTHYAVALKYDKTKAAAPMVVAKGVDFIAFKIKEIAMLNHIPIVENRPLARALYKLVPINGIIPSDMFVAVAEVLAYVYNKGKK